MFSWLTNKLMPNQNTTFESSGKKKLFWELIHVLRLKDGYPSSLTLISQALCNTSTTSFPLYHYLFPFLCSSLLSVKSCNNKTKVWLYVAVEFSQMPTSLIQNISSYCVPQPYTLLSIIWTRYRDNIFT